MLQSPLPFAPHRPTPNPATKINKETLKLHQNKWIKANLVYKTNIIYFDNLWLMQVHLLSSMNISQSG
jgi:hypothetical protein